MLAVVVVVLGDLQVALALLVGSAIAAPFRRITVLIRQKRLTVEFAGPYWRPLVLPLDRIETVSVVDVRPMRHGGWGYRGSLRLFKRLAVVLRSGPGIRIELVGGGWLVITVDDAESACAALQTALRS